MALDISQHSQLLLESEMLLSQRWSLPFLHFICEICCFQNYNTLEYSLKTLIPCFYVKHTELDKIIKLCFHLYDVLKQFHMRELPGQVVLYNCTHLSKLYF